MTPTHPSPIPITAASHFGASTHANLSRPRRPLRSRRRRARRSASCLQHEQAERRVRARDQPVDHRVVEPAHPAAGSRRPVHAVVEGARPNIAATLTAKTDRRRRGSQAVGVLDEHDAERDRGDEGAFVRHRRGVAASVSCDPAFAPPPAGYRRQSEGSRWSRVAPVGCAAVTRTVSQPDESLPMRRACEPEPSRVSGRTGCTCSCSRTRWCCSARTAGFTATAGSSCSGGHLGGSLRLHAVGAARAAARDLGVRAGGHAVRGLRLADLGRLHVPLPQHPAVRASGTRARLRLRDHRRSLPLVRAHERRVGHVVLAICTGWTVAGLTVLPLWTHRIDASGALIWPLFAWCILRSGRSTLFAGIWLATATLEIAGTWAGRLDVASGRRPWTHLPSVIRPRRSPPATR